MQTAGPAERFESSFLKKGQNYNNVHCHIFFYKKTLLKEAQFL